MHQRKPTPTDCTHPQERSPQRRRALLLCAAIAIPLASCQTYEPQPLDPDAYLAAWQARNHDPDDLHHSPGAIWLKEHLGLEPFNDLGDDGTLAKSTLLLFAYNPDIRIARAAVEQARAVARHAGLRADPQFNLELLHDPDANSNATAALSGLSFTIPLSDRLDADRARAAAELASAILAAREVEWDALHELSTTWVQWSATKARRKENLTAFAELHDLIELSAALKTAGELLSTQAALFPILRADLLFAAQANEVESVPLEVHLRSLMGRDFVLSSLFQPTLEVSEVPEPGETELIYRQNPGLLRLAAQHEVAETRLRLEISKQVPDLNLGPALESDAGATRFGLFGGLPIPAWNANRRAIAEARATRDLARITYEARLESTLMKTASAFFERDSTQQLAAAIDEDLIPLLEEQVLASKHLLKIGEGDVLILLQYLTRSHQARLDSIAAHAKDAQANLRLAHLLGPTPNPPASPQSTR